MRHVSLGIGALLVNGALFFTLAWANAREKALPVKDAWVSYEVFHAEPSRTDTTLAAAGEPQAAEPAAVEHLPADAPVQDSTALERLEPRLELSDIDAGVLGSLPVPAPSVVIGDAPSVAPAGIVSGVTAGTGAGGAFSLVQVDRGPRRTFAPLPPYPHWAVLRKSEGVVTLSFVVTAEGSIRNVAVDSVEGDARFGEVARNAAVRWQFEPAVYGGRRVACAVTQRVRFQLTD